MSDTDDWSDEALADADRDQFMALNRDLFLERKAAGVLRADAASWKRLAELANARCDRLRGRMEKLRWMVQSGYPRKSVLERFDAALAKPKEHRT